MFTETITYAADKIKNTWVHLETILPATYNELNRVVMKLVENNNLLSTLYAKLNSPTFTGTPKAPTPAAGDSSTKIATTEWIQNNRATIKDHTEQTTNPLKNITVFDDVPDFVDYTDTTPVPATDLSLVGCLVLVEAYHSGDSWYRKYSDGWIAQGGKLAVTSQTNITINFITTFTALPTNVKLMPWFGTHQGEHGSAPTILSTTLTTAEIRTGEWSNDRVGTLFLSWEACGK